MPGSESPAPVSKKSGDPWLGAVLVLFSLVTVYASRTIQAIGIGGSHDPGPKALPLGIAVVLGAGGLIEIFLSLRARSYGHGKSNEKSTRDNVPDGSGNIRQLLIMVFAFIVTIAVMPFLGFALPVFLMSVGMMVLLGNSVRKASLVTLFLLVAVYLIFVLMFKVPLPRGMLGMPF